MLYPIHHTFLDGRDRYVAGEVREISDADAERFKQNGWLEKDQQLQPPAMLDIAQGQHDNAAEVL